MIKERITRLFQHLAEGIFEKEEAIRLAFLTSIAEESIILLGPPGVAKSLIARKLKYAFREGTSFEYLMSRFSTPDEIFGPVSIKKLKDEDKYERITHKYLPEASIVFLDEIWKAGPAIQNALLTILNEKIYRNGEQEIKVNIRGILAASNEVPAENEGVDALWDRFLVRYAIAEIKSNQNFLKMITATNDVYKDSVPENLKISNEELTAWGPIIENIEIPEEVLSTIQLLKNKLEEHNQQQAQAERHFKIYDRRWKKIIRLLRASAFLHERSKVNLMDCFLMVHCLWHSPEQMSLLANMLSDIIRQHGYSIALNLQPLRKEIQELESEVEAEVKIPHSIIVEEPQSIESEYYEVLGITNYFEGSLIKKIEFGRLSREEQKSISLFDQSLSLVNKVNARLSPQEHCIDIYYNAQVYTLKLKTVQKEKTEITLKKPHPLIEKFWDERVNTLLQYIQQQQERLQKERPEELEGLQEHFFVPAAMADIVSANIQEVKRQLNGLYLQVEKIAHSYRNISVVAVSN